jgi:hypothetical protein
VVVQRPCESWRREDVRGRKGLEQGSTARRHRNVDGREWREQATLAAGVLIGRRNVVGKQRRRSSHRGIRSWEEEEKGSGPAHQGTHKCVAPSRGASRVVYRHPRGAKGRGCGA